MRSGRLIGNPLRLPKWARDAAIQTLPCFRDDVGQAGGNPLFEGADQVCAFFFKHTRDDSDALWFQQGISAPLMRWIRVTCAVNHAHQSRLDERGGAGRCAALSAAGLQSDVNRRAFQTSGKLLSGLLQRLDFGMGSPGPAMVSRPDQLTILHDDRSDRRIRASQADAAPGFLNRHAHPPEIGWVVSRLSNRHEEAALEEEEIRS
jgi:hypothetical protein